MAKAQANAAVYKRMAGKLGAFNNGTGGIRPNQNTPGGTYARKQAVPPAQAASNQAVNKATPGMQYNRKTAISNEAAMQPKAVTSGQTGGSYPRKTAKTTGGGASVPSAPTGGKKVKNMKGID